jgi:uncharacterized protein (DUF58 family)
VLVRLRPTATGFVTGAACTVLGPLAWWLGYPELAVLAAGGLLALAAATAHALLVGSGPVVRREIAPATAVRDEPAVAVLTLTNTGRRPWPAAVAAETCGTTRQPVTLPRLAGGGTGQVSYRLPTARRGPLPIGPLWMERADPLGLVRRLWTAGGSTALLIRPRVFPVSLPAAARVGQLDGPEVAGWGVVTFDHLREYALGDDLRRVHWRSSAHTGSLLVKEFVDAGTTSVTVLLDRRPGRYPDTDAFELAVDAAASVAVSAAARGLPVRLLSTAGPLVTGGGQPGPDALLDALARVRPDAAGTLAGPLADAPAGGIMVLVTGGLCATAELTALAPLCHRHRPAVALRAGDGADQAPALAGLLVLDAPDRTAATTLLRRLGDPPC